MAFVFEVLSQNHRTVGLLQDERVAGVVSKVRRMTGLSQNALHRRVRRTKRHILTDYSRLKWTLYSTNAHVACYCRASSHVLKGDTCNFCALVRVQFHLPLHGVEPMSCGPSEIQRVFWRKGSARHRIESFVKHWKFCCFKNKNISLKQCFWRSPNKASSAGFTTKSSPSARGGRIPYPPCFGGFTAKCPQTRQIHEVGLKQSAQ